MVGFPDDAVGRLPAGLAWGSAGLGIAGLRLNAVSELPDHVAAAVKLAELVAADVDALT